ncbi:MAG: response regulator transcription factor [Halarcobacter sp.]
MVKDNSLKQLNILYLEDENQIRENITKILGYIFKNVYSVSCVDDALKVFSSNCVHVILSDISMPGKTGLDFVEYLRKEKITIPVILLTAHTDTKFLLKAARLKLVDYLTKPIDFNKLKKALLNAGNEYFENNDFIIKFNNKIEYNFNKKILSIDTKIIDITAKEILLLEYLYENKNRVVSKEEIQCHVWEDSYSSTESAFKSLMNKLRNKIGKDSIKNISSVGYQLITYD